MGWGEPHTPTGTTDPDDLDHARAVLARHECRTAGHDFGVETDDHGQPLRLHCARPCGQGPWTTKDAPADPEPTCTETVTHDGIGDRVRCSMPAGHTGKRHEHADSGYVWIVGP